jgi:uncharacterized protein YkwD
MFTKSFSPKMLQITKTEPRKPSVRRSGPSKEFINACLDTHNFYRSRHGIPPLRLSKQVKHHLFPINHLRSIEIHPISAK